MSALTQFVIDSLLNITFDVCESSLPSCQHLPRAQLAWRQWRALQMPGGGDWGLSSDSCRELIMGRVEERGGGKEWAKQDQWFWTSFSVCQSLCEPQGGPFTGRSVCVLWSHLRSRPCRHGYNSRPLFIQSIKRAHLIKAVQAPCPMKWFCVEFVEMQFLGPVVNGDLVWLKQTFEPIGIHCVLLFYSKLLTVKLLYKLLK